MSDDNLGDMTYRDLQAVCKEEGVNAKGKREELEERLLTHRRDGATPRRQPAQDTRSPSPSLTPRQDASAKAKYAMKKARDSPFTPEGTHSPSQTSPGGRRTSVSGQSPSKADAWRQRRGELQYIGLFTLISTLVSLLCAYTMRLEYRPLGRAFSTDARTFGAALAQQWRHLYEEDVEGARHAWRSGVAGGRTAVDLGKFAAGRWYEHAVDLLPSAAHSGTSVVPPPLRGLNVTDDLAVRLFSNFEAKTGREARADAERFAFEASQIYGRSRAPAYVVMHSPDVSSGDAAREILEAFSAVPPGRAACAHVDVAQLPGGEEQGPRLQELAAAQLASHQASLVVVTNAEQLRDSGLAVFLQLIGDESRLNTPGLDVPTKFATVLLLQREGALYGAVAIERAVAARVNATAATALRRRISETTLVLNSPTAVAARAARETAAAAAAAADERARVLKLAADIEAKDAATREEAERMAAEAATQDPGAVAAEAAQTGPAGGSERDEL